MPFHIWICMNKPADAAVCLEEEESEGEGDEDESEDPSEDNIVNESVISNLKV